jgi:putative ABC transport system substrate-binding protein
LTIDGNALRAMGATLGLTIVVGEASNPAEFDAAVSKVIAQGVDMLYGSGSLATNMRVRLIELGNRRRVPAIGTNLSWVEAGALFNYGASQDDQMRRSAQMIDKVLRGSKPADIPVEQLTTYKLVINVRAAKALGITIPSAVLLRADEVIQ